VVVKSEKRAKKHDRWAVFVIAVTTTSIGMMIWAAVFPLLNPWTKTLGISHTQGGILMALFYLPGLLITLPGGAIFDRYPDRKPFVVAWCLIAVGTALMTIANGFITLCAGRLLFATGLNLHNVGAPKLLASSFRGHPRLGLAMGLYTWSFSLGVFASLTFLGRIAESYGWRLAMLLLVVLAGVGLGLVSMTARSPEGSDAELTASFSFAMLKDIPPAMWLIALMYLFYNAGSDSYYTFTPDYLVRRGYALAYASSVVGAYAWIAFTLKPFTSSFLERKKASWFVTFGSAVAITAFVLLVQPKIHPLFISVLIGVSIAFCMPALLSLPAFFVSAQNTGQAYGLLQFSYCLGFFAQPLIGYSIDHTGAHRVAYGLMSMYCAIALIASIALTLVSRQQQALKPIS
jgi:predicted MFS family arabinose efflux permease